MCKNLDFGQKFRKILISDEIFKSIDFRQIVKKSRFLWKFSKISTWVKIVEKSRFLSYFSKNLDFGQNFRKISSLVKSFEKSRFWTKCTKISILVKTFEKARFWSKFMGISILVKILKNSNLVTLEIWKMFGNYRICLRIAKISILVKFFLQNLNFGQNFEKSWFGKKFRKLSILNKMYKNLDQNFRKILISVKIFKSLDFGHNLRKSRFWSFFSLNVDFCWIFVIIPHLLKITKISILVKTYGNIDFSHIISNLVKILGYSRFCLRLAKFSILVKIFEKYLNFGQHF